MFNLLKRFVGEIIILTILIEIVYGVLTLLLALSIASRIGVISILLIVFSLILSKFKDKNFKAS